MQINLIPAHEEGIQFLLDLRVLTMGMYLEKSGGSHLVKDLVNKASQQGRSVGLSVLKNNPAFGLYTKLGFEISQETDDEFELLLNPSKD